MIVRRVDKSFLRYIMDLGMIPLVSFTTTSGVSCISLLRYTYVAGYTFVTNSPWEIDLLKIRPLDIKQIKSLLYQCSPNIKSLGILSLWNDDLVLTLQNNDSVIFTSIYINRDILCEK